MIKFLIALIALALPTYLVRFNLAGIPTTLLELIIYVVFLIGLANCGFSQWLRLKSKMMLPIGLLLAAVFISIFLAPDKNAALGQFKAFFIDPLLVLWLILAYLEKKDFLLIYWGLAASSLFVSAHAIWQKITNHVTADGRVVGIFGYSPNYLALFLVPLTVMIAIYIFQLVFEDIKNKFYLKKLLVGVCLLLINLTAILFSGSRGALLSFGAALAFYFILKFWEKIKSILWLKIGVGLALVLALATAAFFFRPDFKASPDAGRVATSNNVRFMIWQTTLELGSKHPIFGVGLGNFQESFKELTKNRVNYPEYISPWALTPHNLFLMLWLTTGVIGLVAFIWVLVLSFKAGLNSFPQFLGPIFLVAISAIVLQGLVDTPYFKNDLSVMFWFLVGGVIILNRKD